MLKQRVDHVHFPFHHDQVAQEVMVAQDQLVDVVHQPRAQHHEVVHGRDLEILYPPLGFAHRVAGAVEQVRRAVNLQA